MRTPLRMAIAWLVLAFTTPAGAAIIEYDVTHVSGNQWRYDYHVTNDSIGSVIEEFTVWFDLELYEALATPLGATGWDSIAVQPDPNLPDDGFYDSLALGSGIGPGQTLSGFSVLFSWVGAAAPGSQSFQIVDPLSFETIESGFTQLRATSPPHSVPEPGTLALMMCAIAGATFFRNKRRIQPLT